MATKTYHVVWNESKTEGYITDDEGDADYARCGFMSGGSSSSLAQAFRESYGDDDDGDEVFSKELPTSTVAIET